MTRHERAMRLGMWRLKTAVPFKPFEIVTELETFKVETADQLWQDSSESEVVFHRKPGSKGKRSCPISFIDVRELRPLA